MSLKPVYVVAIYDKNTGTVRQLIESTSCKAIYGYWTSAIRGGYYAEFFGERRAEAGR